MGGMAAFADLPLPARQPRGLVSQVARALARHDRRLRPGATTQLPDLTSGRGRKLPRAWVRLHQRCAGKTCARHAPLDVDPEAPLVGLDGNICARPLNFARRNGMNLVLFQPRRCPAPTCTIRANYQAYVDALWDFLLPRITQCTGIFAVQRCGHPNPLVEILRRPPFQRPGAEKLPPFCAIRLPGKMPGRCFGRCFMIRSRRSLSDPGSADCDGAPVILALQGVNMERRKTRKMQSTCVF